MIRRVGILLLVVCSLYLAFDFWRRLNWPAAQGTVLAREFPRRSVARLTVSFVIGVGGEIASLDLNDRSFAYAQAGGFVPGRPISLRYNPADPREGELDGWGRWETPALAATGLVVATLLFRSLSSPAPTARLTPRV